MYGQAVGYTLGLSIERPPFIILNPFRQHYWKSLLFRRSGTHSHRYFNGFIRPKTLVGLRGFTGPRKDSDLETRRGSASFEAGVRDQNEEWAKREVGTHSFAPVLEPNPKR